MEVEREIRRNNGPEYWNNTFYRSWPEFSTDVVQFRVIFQIIPVTACSRVKYERAIM